MKNVVLYCVCWCLPMMAFARGGHISDPEAGNPVYFIATNEDCMTAQTLTIPESFDGTTMLATTDFGAACTDPLTGGTGGNGFHDVWFKFTGTGNDLELSVCNSGTNFDTKLAVYEGSGCFSMTCVAANDDYVLDTECAINVGDTPRKSKIIMSSTLGLSYYVRLDGFTNFVDMGDYTFTIAELVAAPITLVDFWGEPWERGNTLAWETSSEENVMWHIIERSSDGRTSWTEAGKLVSTSTARNGAFYELVDDAPFNETFYRLRTVDYDGSEQISDVIFVKRERPEFDVTKIFPNPVMEQLNFQIDSDRNEDILIRVMDLSGKTVIKFEKEIRDGLNEFDLNVEAWKAGIYFIQFHSRQGYITRKIVKQE